MQIQQNLQKTLANVGSQTVANVNKIHEENAKKVEAIRMNADARVDKAQTSIIQTQAKNPTADFGDLSTELSVMNSILLKDPTKRTAEEKAFVTSMESIGDTMANSLKNTAMSQEVIIEQANKKLGTMGAIDAKADPELYAKLSVLANRTEGRTVARYKTNKNGQVVFSLDVYEKTKDGERFVGSVINDNVGTTQMPDIIPDVNKEMNEFITNTINSVDPTSKLSPVLDNNKKNILYYKDSMGRRVDPAEFREKLEGESVGALAGYTPREIKSLFNNVLKGKDDTEFSYDEGLTDDQRDLANERFVDYMMNQGSVKKVLGNIVEETIPSKTKLPKELTFSEKIKLSERKNKKEAFNKAVGENLASPSISAVSSLDGNLMAVIRESNVKGKFGWMLQRKDGTKWVDVANSLKDDISKLSVQLGYGDPDIITEDESVIFKDNIQPYNKNKFNKFKIN
jgi:hypothetical protein